MSNFQKIVICFCAGVLSAQLLPSLTVFNYLFFIAIVSVVAFRFARPLSFFIFGFIWAVFYAVSIQNAQLPASLENEEILISGKVIDLPLKEPRVSRFLFKVDEVITPAQEKTSLKYIRLSWYGKGFEPRSGEKWQLLVKLKRPHGLANPHGFDYEKWLFQQNIGATGYVRKSKNNKRIAGSYWWSVGYWRESLKNYLDVNLSDSSHVGVIKALVLGDRSDISVEQWDVFRKTGTSHLIAISGLHIGLVSALVFGFVRLLALRLPFFSRAAMQYALVVSLMAAIAYAALAGFSLPTQRALIMLVVVLGGIYFQRHYTPFHIITVALGAVLLYDPLAVMAVGFWLSFGAVTVILYATVGRFNNLGKLKQLFQMQWWVAIGLMPLVLYFFNQVSVIAPLANLLAVPFVSLAVVPMLLIALPTALLSQSLGHQALGLVDMLMDVLWQFLEMLAYVEFSTFTLTNVSLVACVIALIGVALLLLPKGFVPKPLTCVLFVPLFFPVKPAGLQNAEFKLVLLDVGQGLSAVIRTAEHTLVFDTGAKYSEKSDLAKSVIIPYLEGENIGQIDTLVVSHGDNDHAGGANTLLKSWPVKHLMTSVPDRFSDYKPSLCRDGVNWIWDEVEFKILGPSRFNLFKGNNASCVLKVSSVNGSVLLPGDIEKQMEYSLLQYNAKQLSADVMVAPHHGSKSSSTDMFIKEVDPSYVLFPVGYSNRFGFPNRQVLERYEKQGSVPFDTASHGAITVSFSVDRPIQIESFRVSHSKYWNWQLIN
jgi:competence protein ComEC